jgi:hypothetical protein
MVQLAGGVTVGTGSGTHVRAPSLDCCTAGLTWQAILSLRRKAVTRKERALPTANTPSRAFIPIRCNLFGWQLLLRARRVFF